MRFIERGNWREDDVVTQIQRLRRLDRRRGHVDQLEESIR